MVPNVSCKTDVVVKVSVGVLVVSDTVELCDKDCLTGGVPMITPALSHLDPGPGRVTLNLVLCL